MGPRRRVLAPLGRRLDFTVRYRRRFLPQSRLLGYAMPHIRMTVVPVALAVGLISCVVAVPGADKVRLTRNASEVSTCSAAGNIRVNASGSSARTEFRNSVVGFGGNVGLVTNGPAWAPVEGIAYRCP